MWDTLLDIVFNVAMTAFLVFFGAAFLTLVATLALRWAPAKFGRIATQVLATVAHHLPSAALLMTFLATSCTFALAWGDEDGPTAGLGLFALVVLIPVAALSVVAFVASRQRVGGLATFSIWMSAILTIGFAVIMAMTVGTLYLPAGLMLLVAAIARLALSDSPPVVPASPHIGSDLGAQH